MPIAHIKAAFPSLTDGARETSPKDDCYNCIAWAANDTQQHWWPVDYPTNGVHWPVAPDNSVAGFIAAFATLGYEPCDNGALEDGFEKVALYVYSNGDPSHMARQLTSGRWTSKIGQVWEDIEHPTVDDLCGDDSTYGLVHMFLKRGIPSPPK